MSILARSCARLLCRSKLRVRGFLQRERGMAVGRLPLRLLSRNRSYCALRSFAIPLNARVSLCIPVLEGQCGCWTNMEIGRKPLPSTEPCNGSDDLEFAEKI
jgi:hypothetical protein